MQGYSKNRRDMSHRVMGHRVDEYAFDRVPMYLAVSQKAVLSRYGVKI